MGDKIMTINPLAFATKPIPVKTWIFFVMMVLYIALTLALFFSWIAPSLDGRTNQHIAADSTTYLYYADTFRNGNIDPFVVVAMSSFPNTLWVPVLIAFVLKSTFLMVVVNYGMFFLAVAMLKRTFSISIRVFVALLLLNATTTISLLSVNKEIVDLLAISVFFFALHKHWRGLLLLALLVALLNRFEVCIVMVLWLLANGRLNPWRRRRLVTLVALTTALSILLPLVASRDLTRRFAEASSGRLIAFLDSLEMHYLYGIAVIPKIAQNLFGELVNVSNWQTSYGDLSNVANSYILLLNNLATAIVLMILIRKRFLSVRFDLIYFASLGAIIMAVALVIQPRYFYLVYVMLCLQAAHKFANSWNIVLKHDSNKAIGDG